MKKIRNLPGNKVHDPSSIANNQYNESSGAQKQVDVGPKLVAIPTSTVGTTNATTAKALPSMGKNIAVYNNAGTLGVITFGDATVTALAVGAVSGEMVGIPCPPNSWTYLAAGTATHVIASAATLFVFLIEDESSIVTQR